MYGLKRLINILLIFVDIVRVNDINNKWILVGGNIGFKVEIIGVFLYFSKIFGVVMNSLKDVVVFNNIIIKNFL